jgi:hypothetical protein
MEFGATHTETESLIGRGSLGDDRQILHEKDDHPRMRRGWCALFAAPWGELGRYRRYLAGNSENWLPTK